MADPQNPKETAALPASNRSAHGELLQLINDAEVAAFLGAAEFIREKGHPDLAEQLVSHFLQKAG